MLYKLCERSLLPEEAEELKRWAEADTRRKTYMEAFVEREQGKEYEPAGCRMSRWREDFVRRIENRRRRRMYWRMAYAGLSVAATVLAVLVFRGIYINKVEMPESLPEPVAELVCENCAEDLRQPKEPAADVKAEVVADGLSEVIVGRGTEHEVRLPDGSRVWLNACSRLRYAARFGGTERHVELEGEAYFSVSADKSRPFVVDAGGVQVRAYGTEFNVRARRGGCVRTTLVSGSVAVRLADGGQETLLAPGLSAETVPGTQRLTVGHARAGADAGWREGRFCFRETPLEELMGELARWYDLQVEFAEPRLRRERFTGSLSRRMPLVDLLRALQGGGTRVRFRLEGRRLTVGAIHGGGCTGED